MAVLNFKVLIFTGLRGLKWLALLLLMYCLVVLIGLFPVNRDFVEVTDGTTIYIVSNAVHADIIVPRESAVTDWGQFFAHTGLENSSSNATHIAFGWGDRGFFLETQTWEDLTFSVALKALFLPSPSAMHVDYTRPEYHQNKVSVTLTAQQYKKLIDFISRSFKRNSDQTIVQIDGYSYWGDDLFFHAQENYHLFNTCNSWVASALKMAGVRVPWLAPMPKSPTLYLDSQT